MTVVEFLERKARSKFARGFNDDSPDVIVERIRTSALNPYDAIDKLVS